jgi:DNA polymerase sigma
LINEEANEFYERRVIAYERIQFMLGVWKIPIKLFGSCASGITIKNSDIDIAVDNSILNYFLHVTESNRLRAALEQLEQLLIQQPWVTGLKLIKTAAIPLIKLKVNTSVNFIQMPGL